MARLVDLEDIRTALGRYCLALDAYDMDGVAAAFTDDAVADYGPGRGGPLEGRDAIVTRIAAGQAGFARTHHQVGRIDVDLDGDEADAVTVVLAWHERHDGSRDLLGLRYVDRLVRRADRWAVLRRGVEVTIVDGFDGVDWNLVPRAVPTGQASPPPPPGPAGDGSNA